MGWGRWVGSGRSSRIYYVRRESIFNKEGGGEEITNHKMLGPFIASNYTAVTIA